MIRARNIKLRHELLKRIKNAPRNTDTCLAFRNLREKRKIYIYWYSRTCTPKIRAIKVEVTGKFRWEATWSGGKSGANAPRNLTEFDVISIASTSHKELFVKECAGLNAISSFIVKAILTTLESYFRGGLFNHSSDRRLPCVKAEVLQRFPIDAKRVTLDRHLSNENRRRHLYESFMRMCDCDSSLFPRKLIARFARRYINKNVASHNNSLVSSINVTRTSESRSSCRYSNQDCNHRTFISGH